MRPKYGNKKVEHAGIWFDSKLERSLYDILFLMQKSGKISELRHHPGTVFLSDARIQYRPDFRYVLPCGKFEWAEAKGFPNDKWPMKKKLWKHYGPGVLHIWMGSARCIKLVETITPEK